MNLGAILKAGCSWGLWLEAFIVVMRLIDSYLRYRTMRESSVKPRRRKGS